MAQRKVDPITLLRDSFISNAKVVPNDGTLMFGTHIKLPIDTATAWQPPDNLKKYNLGDIWLFLDSKRSDPASYYQRVGEFKGKVQMVSMQHQSNLKRGNGRLLHWQKGLF